MSYNILIIEDNKIDAHLMKEQLKRSEELCEEIRLVYNKEDYEQALQEFEAHLIISDYRMVDFNGHDAIEMRNRYNLNTPIIIVSATIGEEKAVELIREGAADFLIKNNIGSRLVQISLRAINEHEERQHRIKAEKSLKEIRKSYQLLFQNNIDPVLFVNPVSEGKVLEANQAACDLLGYTKQELQKLSRSDLIAETPEKIESFISSRQANKEFRGELSLKHKSGLIIPVENTSIIIEIDDLEKRAFSILRDLRDMKVAEKKHKWENKKQKLQKDIGEILNDNISFEKALDKSIGLITQFLGWDFGHLYVLDKNEEQEYYRSNNYWVNPDSEDIDIFKQACAEHVFEMKESCIGKIGAAKKAVWLTENNKEALIHYRRLDEAKQAGITTGILLPVVVNGTSEAVLEFYTSTPEEQNDDVLQVLENITLQIARLIERKINYENIKKEKDRYQLLAKNSTDMISSHDSQGNYLYISPASERLLGYQSEELLGVSTYELIHPDDLIDLKKAHQKLLVSSEPVTTNYRMKRKEGDMVWVETTSKTISNSEGNTLSEFQCSTRDISDRKKFAQELQKQLKLNEQIINSLPGIFFVIDREGQIQRVNNHFRDLFGFEPNGNNHYTKYIADEDLELSKKRFASTFKEGFTEVELRIKAKNGRYIPYLISAVTDSISQQDYIIGTGVNIEERIRAEENLKKVQTFTDRAINSLPGLFYVLDEEMNFIRFNQSFLDLLEYSEEELKQMHPMDLYLEEDQERIAKAIENAFTKGHASIVSRVKTRSGKLPYFLLTGSYFQEDGKNYILGTGVNITEQKKLEELLDQAQNMAQIGAWEYNLIDDQITWTDFMWEIHEEEPDFVPDLEKAMNYYEEGESRNKLESGINEAIENGTPFDFELQIKTAKNNDRWVRLIGETEFHNGKCIRLFGSIQDINERKKAEEQIKQSLWEKEVLLMEIHHRVKNNLAIVAGFMQLQAYQTDNELVYKYLDDNQSRIQSIALIHEQLYESSSFTVISLGENTTNLISHLQDLMSLEKKIDINLNLEYIIVNINQAIPFALIVNEVITNVFKHAFEGKESGKIDVRLKKSGEVIQLEINDNGNGLPEEFDIDDPETLGFTLLQTLASQLKGELKVDSSVKGTNITLKFEKDDDARGASNSFMNKFTNSSSIDL